MGGGGALLQAAGTRREDLSGVQAWLQLQAIGVAGTSVDCCEWGAAHLHCRVLRLTETSKKGTTPLKSESR